MKTCTLKDILPIWETKKNYILSKDMDVTFGCEIVFPSMFALSNEEIKKMHEAFSRALEMLPSNAVVHLRSEYRYVNPKIKTWYRDEIEKQNDMHFCKRPLFESTSHLFITFRNHPGIPPTILMGCLSKKGIISKEHLEKVQNKEYFDHVEKFFRCIESSTSIVLKAPMECDFENGESLQSIIQRSLFVGASFEAPLEDITFDGECLKVGRRHISILSLGELSLLSPTISPIKYLQQTKNSKDDLALSLLCAIGVLFPREHVVNVVISLGDTQKELSRIERSSNHKHSLELFSSENRTSALEQEQFISKITKGGETICHLHLNLMLWDENEAMLSKKETEAVSAFSTLGWKCHIERNRLLALFLSSIAGAAGRISRLESMTLTQNEAAMFLSSERIDKVYPTQNGVRLVERISGNPIDVDLTDTPFLQGIISNRNKFILGPSGSGKSFFMNHLLHCYYTQGYHIVVLDMGGSYKNLQRVIQWQSMGRDGLEVEYGTNTGFSMNPFRSVDSDDSEKLDSIMNVILSLWKHDSESVSRREETFLAESIALYTESVKANKRTGSMDGYVRFVEGEYQEKLRERNISSKEFPLMEFLSSLKPYTHRGKFSRYIDSNMEEDLLSNRFILFDIDRVKDNRILKNILLLSLTECYMEKLRKLPGKRKVIVMDEVWKAISSERMADYLRYLFKTVRKHEGEAIVLSQEIEDLVESPIVKQTIVCNSDCRILFDMKHNRVALERLRALLALDGKAMGEIESLNSAIGRELSGKDVWIGFSSGESHVFRVEVSPTERILYSSDEKTKEEMERYMLQGLDPISAAQRILQNKQSATTKESFI
ncbi:MAG: TraG family conjugative transposon ATPase [Alistipes sp.]|nr:TraG family conjugative transposon ATPase [Candidatus Alistipes equi]